MTFKIFIATLYVAIFLSGCGGSSGSTSIDNKNETAPPATDENTDGDTEQDTTPDEFSFSDKVNVDRESWISSETITITGLSNDISVPIEAEGLEFSIDGGEFTALSGSIKNGQSLTVRVFSSADFSSTKTTKIYIGTESVSFSITTAAQSTIPPADTTPDAFAFSDVIDIDTEIWVESETVTISGLDDNVSAVVSSNHSIQFSIDGGAYTMTSSEIKNGQTLKVRLFSSEHYGTLTSASVTISDTTVTFAITTKEEPQDISPDTFSFNAQSDVEPNTWIESETRTITGISKKVAITTYSGLQYSIDGAEYTSSEGVINNGQTLQVRMLSSHVFNTEVTKTVKVGDFSAYFSATTYAKDITPDTFSFANQIDIAQSNWIESEVVTISGINSTGIIIASGLEYSVNGADYTNAQGSIEDGQTLQVRIFSNSDFDQTSTGTILIGNSSFTFSVTTLLKDITPDNFSFNDKTNIAKNSWIESEVITISGLNTLATISVNNLEYSIDGNEFTTHSGTIENNQDLKVRVLSSSDFNKTTSGTISLGNYTTEFSATTLIGIPQLTSLSLSDDSLFKVGSHLYAEVACNFCDVDSTEFNWSVDVNGEMQTISTDSMYAVDAQYLFKDITLTARAINSAGVKGNTIIQTYTLNRVVDIFSTEKVFAAIKSDGSVITWGEPDGGGDSSDVSSKLRSGVIKIFGNNSSLVALKDNGSVIAWGVPNSGGRIPNEIQSQLNDVITIVSNLSAHAAIKEDGSVVAWGWKDDGGDITDVEDQLTSGVISITPSDYAFAALKDDGSVVTWGDYIPKIQQEELKSGVVAVYSNQEAFAALKVDGSVITWGTNSYGGDGSVEIPALNSDVAAIYTNQKAFTAVKTDGSVIAWGNAIWGGEIDVSGLESEVAKIYATKNAFAALKHNGSVVAWGVDGGSVSSSIDLTNIRDIYPVVEIGFSAIKNDGSAVAWGKSSAYIPSNLKSKLSSGVQRVFTTEFSMAALKDDGSVVTWGIDNAGGNSNSVISELSSGVVHVYATENAFAAKKQDGSIVLWGHDAYGGFINDASALSPELVLVNEYRPL